MATCNITLEKCYTHDIADIYKMPFLMLKMLHLQMLNEPPILQWLLLNSYSFMSIVASYSNYWVKLYCLLNHLKSNIPRQGTTAS